ncbi:MAG: DUF4837 family protein [Bacteroidales bacterium]|nr:DUF4837 family protein [Bacteroidales bacterium]
MRTITKILMVAVAIITAVSCDSPTTNKRLLPNISGKAGEVLVVMRKDDWNGNAGNVVRDILADDCPFLPQKEPLYTLVNVQPSGFGNMFKVHRNIVYFNISATPDSLGSERIIFRNDVWAAPQCMIQINSANADSAAAIFQKNASVIVNALEQAERDRVISNVRHYEAVNLPPVITDMIGGTIHIANGYELKKKTENFMWIADDKQFSNQGIFIYKYPVTNDNPFSVENIVAKRNEFLKANVPGMFDGTYMMTSEFATPQVTFMKYKGHEFAETRGLWEVYNDYMGGPFVSHSFYNQDGTEIIVMEAWVYAPKYDKRQYLRQTESMLYSFEWKD